MGRPILVYVARNLPTRDVDLDRVLLYMLLVLDPIVSTDYVMLYLHTDAGSENVPDLSWLRKVHSIFNRKCAAGPCSRSARRPRPTP